MWHNFNFVTFIFIGYSKGKNFSKYSINCSYQMKEDCITHALPQNTTGNCRLVPGPVPGSEDSGLESM